MFKKQICLTVSTLLLTAAMLPVYAQGYAPLRGQTSAPVTANMRPHTSQTVVIPELTEVPVILKDAIQAPGNRVGSELLFFVAKDVYGPGHVLLITRNTPVLGQIAESHLVRSSGRAGKLCLRCDYILAQDKTRIALTGIHHEARTESQSIEEGLVGHIDVGVTVDVFNAGKDAKLPIGKTYSVYVNADTRTETPIPYLETDDINAGAPREAFALLKDGSWAIGIFRQVGNTYVLTNSGESQTVKISDVRSLEFLKDVKVPYNGN